jgi:hypothetical protein
MDPYLEAHRGDMHLSLISYARETLQISLPRDLRARAGERVFVESENGHAREVYPDVRVYERATRDTMPMLPTTDSSGVALVEPLIVPIPNEPKTERFIEIREAGTGGRVITVIEFVSPANKKKGDGRKLYLQKQNELRAAGVNSVEIDLLRRGKYTLAVPEGYLPPEYRTPYRVCIWRAVHPIQYEVYRVPLRERLPTIRIPLRETDDDVPLDLQALVERAYDTGGYDDLDYELDPDPPLKSRDAQWADALLRERGLRTA